MKAAIIYAGHFGTTKKAAEILSSQLNMESVLIDANGGVHESDISDYGTIIFGSNIRMLMLNKHFRKVAKSLKKSLEFKTVYGYIIGLDATKADKYIVSFKRRLPQTKHVVFAGGALSKAPKGFTRNIIESVSDSLRKEGKQPPTILEDNLTELANVINNPPLL